MTAPDYVVGVAGLVCLNLVLFLGPGEERGCWEPLLPGALSLRNPMARHTRTHVVLRQTSTSAQMAESLVVQVFWQLKKKSYLAFSKQRFCSHDSPRSVLGPILDVSGAFSCITAEAALKPGCLGWNFRTMSCQLWDAGGIMEASSPFLSSPVTCSYQQNEPSGFLSK